MFKYVVYRWVFIHQNVYRKLYSLIRRERQGKQEDSKAVPRLFQEKRSLFDSGIGRCLWGTAGFVGFSLSQAASGRAVFRDPSHGNPVGASAPSRAKSSRLSPRPPNRSSQLGPCHGGSRKHRPINWPKHRKWVWPSRRSLYQASTSQSVTPEAGFRKMGTVKTLQPEETRESLRGVGCCPGLITQADTASPERLFLPICHRAAHPRLLCALEGRDFALFSLESVVLGGWRTRQ